MNGLFGSRILEAAAGLSLIYLMLASFCSTANEWIAILLHTRAATLRASIHHLLSNQQHGEQAFADLFYAHPLIACLVRDGVHPPSIPAAVFSTAILDLVTPQAPGSITFTDLKSGIESLPAGSVRTALLALIQNTDGDLHRAQANIETWFDDTMQRASSWYKRRAQLAIVLLAAVVTVATNADSIAIAHRLTSDVKEPFLGWNSAPHQASEWVGSLAGWLLTIGSVSLGAPFWFDVLNHIVHIRQPHVRSKRGASV